MTSTQNVGSPTRTGPPYRQAPPDFREVFLRINRLRAVQRHYATSRSCIRRWIEENGGEALLAERAPVIVVKSRLSRMPEMRERAFAAYLAGATITEAARVINIDRRALGAELRRCGILRPTTLSWDREAAVSAYISGASLTRLSRVLNVDRRSLRRALTQRGALRPYVPWTNLTLRDPRVRAFLGRAPDAVIAAVAKCASSTVWEYRRSLDVARYKRPPRVPIRIYSIDAPRLLGGSYHDVYKDHRWSDWLEEVGATVC